MNEMAKVEIEIFQNIYNSNSYKEATNGLEKLIFENPNLEPKLKSLCFQKLGQWQFEYYETNKIKLEEQDYQKIIANCHAATQICPENALTWHYFSTTNYEASIYFSRKFANGF